MARIKMQGQRGLWWLVLLLLLGALFRIHNAGVQNLWGDESWTWYLTTQADFWGTLAGDVHPPLYFGMLYMWAGVVGDSELALRYLSMLFGMVGLATIYPLSREVMRWRPLASHEAMVTLPFVAMFLLAIADMEVHVAQEARTYTLQIVLAMVGTLAYLRWARTGARGWALLWVVASVGIVHTHYLGAFTPVAQGLHALFFLNGRRRIEAIGLLVLSAVMFMPWLLSVVLGSQLGTFSGNLATDPSTWETLWSYRISFFTHQWALLLCLTLFGVVVLREGRVMWRPFSGSALLLFWAMVPVVLTYIANYFLPLLHDYRISQIVPPLTLLMALGIVNLRGRERYFLLVVIGVYGFLATDVYRPKPDWEGYSRQIAEFVQIDDAILSDFSGGDYMVTYYLGRLLESDVSVRSMWQWRYWEGETYEAGIFEYIESHNTVWVPHWNNADDEIFNRMKLVGYVQTSNRPFQHHDSILNIYRYDRIDADAAPLATFDNGMSLLKAGVNPRGGVALLWRVDEALTVDYTIAVYLLDEAGAVVAQFDAPPTIPTSQWGAGDIRADGKSIPLDNVSAGDYRLAVAIYQWSPDGIQNALVDGDTVWLGDIYRLED